MIFVRLVGWPRLISATAVLVLPGVVAYNQALLCWSFRRSARRVASTFTARHTVCQPTPKRRANDLVFSGRRLPATEAHALGLVDHLVAVEEFGTEVARRAAELAAGPTIALGLAKRLLDQSLESSGRDGTARGDGSGRLAADRHSTTGKQHHRSLGLPPCSRRPHDRVSRAFEFQQQALILEDDGSRDLRVAAAAAAT